MRYCQARGKVWGEGFPDTLAMIGDCDTHISETEELMKQIAKHCRFKRTYFEALDEDMHGVLH